MHWVLGLLAALWLGAARAQVSSQNPNSVQSVTGQTGNVNLPSPCAQTSIPAGVGSTATETQLGSVCVFGANTMRASTATLIHVGGIYSAALSNAATGRVYFTNNATPAPGTDTAVLNTGALNGIAGGANLLWWGDIWITFLNTTTIDVQGLLFFQAGTNVQVPLSNSSTFTIDPTKPLTFYLTVQWSSNSASNVMQLRTMVAK